MVATAGLAVGAFDHLTRVFCTLRICTALVEAANRLGAGRAGGFGLVTGVARTGMFSGAVTLLA